MNFPLKRFFSLLILLGFALTLTGCGNSGTNSFTWYVDAIPANLDPQVAATSEDVTACTNLYAGLMRKGKDGTPVTALCEGYRVSPDGLTYTFTLPEGLVYLTRRGAATEYAITAEDFVFTFRRIYAAETDSPYTDDFAAIAGSAAVLAGTAAPETLGVTALDERTVQFTLSQPDEAFLRKLTLPGAAPCDEAFFESTGGTYGLTMASTLSSGSFYLQNWTANGLFLRRSAQDDAIDSLRLVQNTGYTTLSAAELVEGEHCSAALDTGYTDTALPTLQYSDTTWCVVFNQNDRTLANGNFRAALAAAAYGIDLAGQTSDQYGATAGLIPAGVQVDGLDYRGTAGTLLPAQGDAKALYTTALAEGAAPSNTRLSLLVPEGSEIAALAQTLNAAWQKQFSLFLSIETVPSDQLQARLSSGSYTIALVPLQMTRNDPLAMLSRFEAGGFTGYANVDYTQLCRSAAAASGSERLARCAEAEALLLAEHTVVPLFCQNRQLVVAPGVTDLLYDPYGPVLDLHWASRPVS